MICEVLRTDIEANDDLRGKHVVWDAYWTQLLLGKYEEAVKQACTEGTPVPPPREVLPPWVLDFGERLAEGEIHSMGIIFNLDGVHWVATVVDFEAGEIFFADSMGRAVPSRLRRLFDWWLAPYVEEPLVISPLACTQQGPDDMFSCGICAPNAIAHHYLPALHPLIAPDAVHCARMDLLNRELTYVHKPIEPLMLPDFVDNDLGVKPKNSNEDISAEIVLEKPVKTSDSSPHHEPPSPTGPAKPKTLPKKRIRVKGTVKGSGDKSGGGLDWQTRLMLGKAADQLEFDSDAPPLAKRPRKRKSKKKSTAATAQNPTPSQRSFLPNPDDMISDATSPNDDSDDSDSSTGQPSATAKTGRPRKPLLDRLTRLLSPVDGRKRYACAGKNCRQTWSGRTLGRVLGHASRCQLLSSARRMEAHKASSDDAPSARFERAAVELGRRAEAGSVSGALMPNLARPSNTSTSTTTKTKQLKLDLILGETSRGWLKAQLDPIVLKLVCCGGISPQIVDSQWWKKMWEIANNKYLPVSRSTLEETQIPQEAEYVRRKQIERLRTQNNLTLTYDGGANRRHQSFYTVHVTTAAPDRRAFLVDVIAGSRVSHTADWLSRKIVKVIDLIGRGRFSAASSDSTGNTRLCRRRLCATIPTMFDIPDPVHHTNLPIKNICKLSFFKEVISVLRRTLQFFSKSDQASEELGDIRGRLEIPRGLEKIGKTRFAMIMRSAVAMRRCLPALRNGCSKGTIKIEETNECFISDSPSTLTFETQLNQLLSVGLPYTKTIVCLESLQCTLADVFLYWCGIGSNLKQVLGQKASGIPESVKAELRAIFNSRWKEMFEDGPTHAHLAAVYLDPAYVSSDIFKGAEHDTKRAVKSAAAALKPGAQIKHPHIFRRVGNYLAAVLGAEVEHGEDPLLRVPEKQKKSLKARFFNQFLAYAQNDYPFNAPRADDQSVLEWWLSVKKSAPSQADILATLAVKLYSIMPNSMPDECTASIFTRLNSPVRNQMSLQAMVSQAQIQQYYHFETSRATVPPSTAKKFYAKLNSKLREDTSLRKDTKVTNLQAKLPAIEPDDEDDDIDEPNGAPAWLDEDLPEAEHCGTALIFEIETYINLESAVLRDLLASDVPDQSGVSDAMGDSAGTLAAHREQDDSDDDDIADKGGPVQWTFDFDV
ncbi:hypothetical protein EVJ58_g7909 [Rhodofomes roseus]|uniref:Ubiquitin-like protease family profile domain-containing protein n=1 Tax=Rhodofomes roseus TaxID=34475 RepID=A0A4Y9Y0X2_9APHY|nr:hypothetical protein EVJ58_g7909 [Rhodofomes roseus]